MQKMFEKEKGKNMNLQDKIDEIIEEIIHISEGYDNRCPNEVYSILQKIGKQLQELKEYKPKVKQLEWEKNFFDGYVAENDILLIRYVISSKTPYILRIDNKPTSKTYESVGEAKAAAQSHYESLILGCLENE